MANRRVLSRLLRLRELEEEMSRMELESAVGDRNRVAGELAAAVNRQALGRQSFLVSIGDSDTAGRTGSVISMEQARKLSTRIAPRLEAADREVVRRREEFLSRRTGRQQVETLVEREQRTLKEEAARRAQQILDDWYGRRSPRQGERGTKPAIAAPEARDSQAEISLPDS
jgi:flagellar export protein FliJ